MTKVLFVAPTSGNGGITSWAANYMANMTADYELIPVSMSKRRSTITTDHENPVRRIVHGLLDMLDTALEVNKVLKHNPDIKLMHVTTSGSLGSVRDLLIGYIAKKRQVKSIMHCHYGCISEDYLRSNIMGKILRMSISLYNQIWVLDSKSEMTLNNVAGLNNRIFKTPNFIEVPETCTLFPKEYKNVAFVGNLAPTKGLYELIRAVNSLDNGTVLHIIGPGTPDVNNVIKSIAKDNLGGKVVLYGKLPNKEAIEIINKMDIIALPTYYQWEAFPISILEAMSRGKMVISCPRAAIPDMLKADDNSFCGLLVKEKDEDEIRDAIIWCQTHKSEADIMCEKAYHKVYNSYRTDVVMKVYTNNYHLLLNHD